MAALAWVPPDVRAISTTHIPFQFMDWRCLWSTHDIQCDCLMGVAAQAFDFEVEVTGIERIA